jgi:hypothetical protein
MELDFAALTNISPSVAHNAGDGLESPALGASTSDHHNKKSTKKKIKDLKYKMKALKEKLKRTKRK